MNLSTQTMKQLRFMVELWVIPYNERNTFPQCNQRIQGDSPLFSFHLREIYQKHLPQRRDPLWREVLSLHRINFFQVQSCYHYLVPIFKFLIIYVNQMHLKVSNSFRLLCAKREHDIKFELIQIQKAQFPFYPYYTETMWGSWFLQLR